ncbi:LacI family DNA-binding transcriptional regulator [Pedococcus sp. 5OH_020]|uniref:LacI family DNA-binding transcriptional regulator n=1 Tax=Pedococcus sp. 5OH_020 TaxID=2989814 RepID=UPI0022E9D1AA|nr:LacI family DNA-binding transcriptional regulator [Pedococcus sp. 5OH_020]
MAKVGISDVAREARVSEATVSRVLNHRGIVAPDTRRAVEEAMQQLGYSSRATTSKVVLLLTPDLDNPFFAQLCARIVAGASSQGLQAVVGSAPSGGSQEYECVASMVNLGVVGVVFVSTSNTIVGADPSVPNLLLARNIPFLCINGSFPDTPMPALATNDAVASELAVDHLWSLGHRKIGLIAGPRGNRPSDRRVAGFSAALKRRGGEGGVIVHHEYSVEGGSSAAASVLDAGVTAIIGASDDIALGAVRSISRRGLRVPDDVSVIGFDDVHPLEFTNPPLTTVRQPIDRLAAASVRILQRLIQRRHADSQELLFDPDLIIRASTGRARQ